MAGVKLTSVCLESTIKREQACQKRMEESGKHKMLSDRLKMHNKPLNGITSKYVHPPELKKALVGGLHRGSAFGRQSEVDDCRVPSISKKNKIP